MPYILIGVIIFGILAIVGACSNDEPNCHFVGTATTSARVCVDGQGNSTWSNN